MATVTGLTAARMLEIEAESIVDGDVVGGNLILTKHDGSTINAGSVIGPPVAAKGSAFPGAPTDGDLFIRTDQTGDPLYKYTDGVWTLMGGGSGLSKVTAFPASPADGDVVVRTDMNGSPLYAYSTENGWEAQPRMGAVTVPYVQGNIASPVSIPNDLDTAVAFNLETQDTDNMHDMVSNTTRLTARTPGRYLLSVYANWASNTGGNFRMIAYRLNAPGFNAAEEIDRPNARGGFPSENTMTRVLNLKAGDFVEIYVRQDIGGSLNLNALTADLLWLGGPGQTVDERGVPAAKATSSVQQSIPNGVFTTLSLWNQESYDTDSIHDQVTNPGRLTIKTAGLYRIAASVYFGFGANARLRFMKNGATLLGDSPNFVVPGGGSPGGFITAVAEGIFAPGDYIEVQLFHDNGVSQLAGFTFVDERMYFAATLLGSGKQVTPFVRAYTGGLSVPTGVNTAVPFEFETADNDATHDTVTNNTRLVCRTAGVYTILAQATWQGTAGGQQRYVFLQKNGSQVIGIERRNTNASGPATEVSALVELAVGDYVELIAFQDSGGAVLLNGSATDYTGTTFFSMAKIGAPLAGQTGIGPAQANMYTVATLPTANLFPNGRIVGVSDGAAGQQARMAMNGAWINLG